MKFGIVKTGTPLALTILAVLTVRFGKTVGLAANWTGVLAGALFMVGFALFVNNQQFAATTETKTNGTESYYARVWKRFWTDATPWARDNIGWGAVVLVVPPIVVFFRNRHAPPIDWTLIRATLMLYAVVLPLYFAVHLICTPKKLDKERDVREASLRQEIAARDETIRQQNIALAKPKITAAEQNDYETARKVLKTVGKKGLIALRHIRLHGSLIFGIYPPVLPPGLNRDDALWVFNHCASEGVLTCKGAQERTFAVAPKMEKILDDLLYSEDVTA